MTKVQYKLFLFIDMNHGCHSVHSTFVIHCYSSGRHVICLLLPIRCVSVQFCVVSLIGSHETFTEADWKLFLVLLSFLFPIFFFSKSFVFTNKHVSRSPALPLALSHLIPPHLGQIGSVSACWICVVMCIVMPPPAPPSVFHTPCELIVFIFSFPFGCLCHMSVNFHGNKTVIAELCVHAGCRETHPLPLYASGAFVCIWIVLSVCLCVCVFHRASFWDSLPTSAVLSASPRPRAPASTRESSIK